MDQMTTGVFTDWLWDKTRHLHKDSNSGSPALHLGIFVEPFLGAMLDGTKLVESRFSKNRIAPYKQVEPGDIVTVKASSGPVVGYFQVGSVSCYLLAGLEPNVWQSIVKQAPDIRCSHEHLELQRNKPYATLMGVSNMFVLEEPIRIGRKGQTSWVVLKQRGANNG